MKQELIAERLVSEFGDDVVKTTESVGQIAATVPKEKILEIAAFLRQRRNWTSISSRSWEE